jgi:rhodanese-related sulfurtransferase
MNKNYKNIVSAIIVVIAIFMLVVCISFNSMPENIANNPTTQCSICIYSTLYTAYKNITVNELKIMMDEKANITIIDVREPEEYANGHIPTAINIPLHELPLRINELKEKNIVVYCASGVRSKASAEMLSRNGVQNVWNLVGGLKAWVNAGYPIEK